MVATYRFPVVIWKDHQGWFTASLVEWEERAGIGRTSAAAMEQLQALLSWKYRRAPYFDRPNFHDAELVEFKVAIRPEYQQGERRYACKQAITLRVSGVIGRQEPGMLICSLPLLDERFYFNDRATLSVLATQYAQKCLEGQTPQQLARYLPAASMTLSEIVLRLRPAKARPEMEVEYETLKSVAEHLGDARVRKLYSRPWEREGDVSVLVERLRKKANVVLLGATGCGKTTVLVEAAKQIERTKTEQESDKTEDKTLKPEQKQRCWLTSAGRIISGMKYLGQWEERCEQLIAELAHSGGILCVDNLLELVRQGGEGPVNSIAAFLLPFLQRGEVTLVGEATPAEFDACQRLLPGFADVFQVLKLEPMNREKAIKVLDRLAGLHSLNMRLPVATGVIDQVFHLFNRFMPYQAFPGPANRFLTQLFENSRQAKKQEITKDDVIRQFVRQTGLPELLLRDELPLPREEVVAAFRTRIIGQTQPIEEAANLVVTFKAGLNDPNRPVGVLLFCGPTGVGKTELARAIAKYLFGAGDKADRLIRLDMSEYAGPGAGGRLLTQADGHPSELIRSIREQPFNVVLLDEIEKADPIVFDVLMGLFDEGRLTDQFGRTAIFRSAIIIMTSNLGSDQQGAFGFGGEVTPDHEAHAMEFFRPEFFNRMDAVINFEALDPEDVEAITRKELGEIASREGLTKGNNQLVWSDAVVAHLAEVGFDRRYGARPLQRTIERLAIAPLACYLLANPGLKGVTLQLEMNGEGGIDIVQLLEGDN
jgi:ATP-dependent Clp protease ATP-binding subunit ClpC